MNVSRRSGSQYGELSLNPAIAGWLQEGISLTFLLVIWNGIWYFFLENEVNFDSEILKNQM